MLLSKGTLTQGSLKDEVAIVTGAGRGIGYEAARGLIWLGANVVIAEVNEVSGRAAAENLEEEWRGQSSLCENGCRSRKKHRKTR